MAKVTQVRKAVRPALKQHSDLAIANSWIFVKPAHHFVRAVLIGGTSHPERFEARWTVMHLFEVRTSVHLNWGGFLWDRRWANPGFWWKIDEGVEQSLMEAIETQALPVLRAMRTLDDFLAYVAQNTYGPHLYEWPTSRIILDVALGDLDHARAICAKHYERWSTDDPRLDDIARATYARLTDLCARLLADDRPGLVRLLHDWEAQTVRNLKIEHIWEPTPFPIELQA
jgi:hypothetical protein